MVFPSEGPRMIRAPIFASGNGREVAPGGSIGVHQRRALAATPGDTQLASAELLALFRDAGIAPEVFILASRTPPDEMYSFDADELVRFGIIRSRS